MHNPKIQPGDVLEWDFDNPYSKDEDYVRKHGMGPLVCEDLRHGFVYLEDYPQPGYYPERFRVNAFLTAVRKAKLRGPKHGTAA